MKLTRESYRPKEGQLERPEGLPEGYEIWRYERQNGKRAVYAMVFGGKRSEPDWHFRFKSDEHREERIADWVEDMKSRIERVKLARKELHKPHDFKVGQLFSTSWGYDQTNVDYYKLTELKGKTMGYIVPIGSKTISSNPPQEMVAPDPDYIREWDVLLGKNQNDGPPEPGKWKKLRTDGFSMGGGHYHASPCEPDTARYETSSGWGH